jgi:hypothetical protein
MFDLHNRVNANNNAPLRQFQHAMSWYETLRYSESRPDVRTFVVVAPEDEFNDKRGTIFKTSKALAATSSGSRPL